MGSDTITLLSTREIDKMRRAGHLAAELLDYLAPMVQPGVSTQTLNDEAERWTKAHGAVSAPLGYHGFPKSICTSVNEVICHGIPNPRQILKGEILSILMSRRLSMVIMAIRLEPSLSALPPHWQKA